MQQEKTNYLPEMYSNKETDIEKNDLNELGDYLQSNGVQSEQDSKVLTDEQPYLLQVYGMRHSS